MNKNYCPYCMTPVPEGESCSVCKLTSGKYVPSPHHLPPGTILQDRYLVGRVLGEGGFGITYIGRDLRLELKVAIKEYYPMDRATRNAAASLEVTSFIGPSALSFQRGKQKFLNEAQVMARMDKQQVIVGVRDFFEINNTAYIVMEYVEGITLHELVEQKGGKILPDELFPLLEPLFHALSTMHGNGLIHRDISPDNLMLENGKIRLLDFGCAREASRGTETMTIALKHGYAPIEQYQQKGQGPWTDLYALCATIYYALTGKVPPQALDRITEDELLLPSKLGVDLSPEQEKALLKGMRIQPNRRYDSAEELWAALCAQRSDEQGTAQPAWDAGTAGAPAGGVAERRDGAEREGMAEREDMLHEEASQPDDSVQIPQQVAADGTEAEAPAASGRSEGRRKLLGWIGAAGIAVCILAIALGVITRPDAEETLNPGEGAGRESVASASVGDTEPPSEESPQPRDSSDGFPEENLFESAYRFTDGDEAEFRRLMEDDAVEALILDCGEFQSQGELSVRKPVLLAQGTLWRPDRLTVEDGGTLRVEGELDMSGGGYLRLKKGSVRLSLADGGTFDMSGLIWMDEEQCMDDGARKNSGGQTLVFSEDVFQGEDVQSVTDFASLKRALDAGGPVSIDGDILLTDYISFSVPVRISEGVTVRGAQHHDETYGDSLCQMEAQKGSVLVNEGTLENIFVESHSAVINRGLLIGLQPEGMIMPTLWFSQESALVNLGTVDGDGCSRLLPDAVCINLGTIHAYQFSIAGGNMVNFSSILLPEDHGYLEADCESRFRNAPGACVTVSSGTELSNRSLLVNEGDVIVETGGRFTSALLENNGVFRAQDGADIRDSEAGILFGNGEYQLEGMDLKTYFTEHYDMPNESECISVSNGEELLQALDDPSGKEVYVVSDVSLERDAEIRKNLWLAQGCSLTMEEGAKLTVYGARLAAGQESGIQGSDIRFYEDAQLYLSEDAELNLEEGGCLILDDSLLWGGNGRLKVNGGEWILKNRAAFLYKGDLALEAVGGQISLGDKSVFATPRSDSGSFELEGASIALQDSEARFWVVEESVFKDCELNIEAGFFSNQTTRLTFQNSRITVEDRGYFQSNGTHAKLELVSGSAMENRGMAEISGWTDGARLTIHGTVKNYGEMAILVPTQLSDPILNEGILYYNAEESARYRREMGRDMLDLTMVEGNAPVSQESVAPQ